MIIRESELLRESNRITSYIEKYVIRLGTENRDEVLNLFESMHKLFPQYVISTCPLMHPDILYVSQNAKHVFGYEGDYLIRNSKMDKYWSHIHEADQKDLYQCASTAHDILESIPPEEHPLHRFVFHYRFKKSNSQYIYLLDEKAVVNLRGSGNLYYVVFRDITAEKTFNGVKVEIFRQDEVVRKMKDYKPSAERILLSKREQELVGLIKQGLSTKEIAWHLSISHNTVRNIKSKLFEKYNVSNSIELLNMTG